ncbi:23S rRNA (uracil(747)-C(5))-methyltransferase [Leucobacter sp. gxy201]|uniref:23S rRNA (uracil(747)-C(5))-methyltransferase n=1 Tax=Leucobacter sp. gxy201 TaxID=2957200 RepID=UPI003D9FEF10
MPRTPASAAEQLRFAPPQCGYFAAGLCRSCTFIETPYAAQLDAKERRCRELLPQVPATAWLPSVDGGGGASSSVRDFRNKAKLVVGGVAGRATLGILGPDGEGVDLRECLIQAPAIRAAIPLIAAFIERTGLEPYSVPRRRGELKFVHVTVSPDDQLMLRFVTRTRHGLDVLRARLPQLRESMPGVAVVSVNLLPEHKAVLEGEHEELLLGSSLHMASSTDPGEGAGLGGSAASGGRLALHLLPQSFFQTNTAVARELYAQASAWVQRLGPSSIWDLYCGVGGFALHAAVAMGRTAGAVGSQGAPAAPRVLGVEVSESAVRSARRSARDAGIDARFEAADATAFALSAPRDEIPELVIVNPPRRGIGPELCDWLEHGTSRHVVYSSCNPESLARDLAAMPSLAVREARLFDMFPHTRHLEAAVLLERA